MKIYCYTVTSDIDSALSEFERLGVEVLYSNESADGRTKEIFAKQKIKVPFAKVKEQTLEAIDWAKQWNNFEIPIGSKILKLNPGPGFGDLSHPTTRLVLDLMSPHVKNAHVLDIGCGSGILSMAAKALGAATVHGIDIDPSALEHAKENAAINDLDITFGLPEDYRVTAPRLILDSAVQDAKAMQVFESESLLMGDGHSQKAKAAPIKSDYGSKNCVDLASSTAESRLIVLMNMISSEQEIALKSLPMLRDVSCEFFISGVLEEEKYERDWTLMKRKAEEGWLGFHYRYNF